MVIRQAGSLIDLYQSAWAERQADFDPEKVIQRLSALAVQAAHSGP
jgi:hypothetical protein